MNSSVFEVKVASKIKLMIWLGLIILLSLLIKNNVLVNVRIASPSMFPTLCIGDRAIGLRSTIHPDIQRGDIIVFSNDMTNNEDNVTRIIGLPEEIIELTQSVIYVNGNMISDYIDIEFMSTENWGPVTTPLNSYFVLGDNRTHSKDSQVWDDLE